jgi:hypothetical protein
LQGVSRESVQGGNIVAEIDRELDVAIGVWPDMHAGYIARRVRVAGRRREAENREQNGNRERRAMARGSRCKMTFEGASIHNSKFLRLHLTWELEQTPEYTTAEPYETLRRDGMEVVAER